MKTLLALLFLSLVFPQSGTAQGIEKGQIRVRLSHGLQSLRLQGSHMEVLIDGQLYQPTLPSEVSTVQIERFLGSKKDGVRRNGWRLRWSNESKPRLVHGGFMEVRGSWIKQGNIRLPRVVHLYVEPEAPKKFDLISELDLETYLFGVLPREMPASWPLEALKAQAVAARSFALSKIKERKSQAFDVEASVLDQAFEYSPSQVKKTKFSDRISRVIEATRGQVLTYNGKIAKAYYHSDCGGKTETANNVWGASNNYNGVVAACQHSHVHTWSFAISRNDFVGLLMSGYRRAGQGTALLGAEIKGVHVASLNPSGRVQKLIVQFADKERLELSAQMLRTSFGYDRLKSAFFKVEMRGNMIEFKGTGFGHGVGMCQFGAKAMANAGQTYQQILKQYFPNTELKRTRQIL